MAKTYGSMTYPSAPDGTQGFLGRLAYGLKNAQFRTQDKFNIADIHACKYFLPIAAFAQGIGMHKTAMGIMGAVAAVSLAEKANDAIGLFREPASQVLGKEEPPKQDVHDVVKNPIWNRLFHLSFSFLSFGSLKVPEGKSTLERLGRSEYSTTGTAQALEVYSSKYLFPAAAGLYATGHKKAAYATLTAMTAVSGVGQAMDSIRLFRDTAKKDHSWIALGRLGRGLAYGLYSTHMAHQMQLMSTMGPN